MAGDDERAERPELPRSLANRYRPRWKEPPPGAPEGTKASLVARDTIVDRELDLARVPFGAARAAERDALVAGLKARTTVLHPSLVAIHDAGEWEDDAFVLTEQVERPVPLRDAIAGDAGAPSIAERLRWARALSEVAMVLDEAGLALPAEEWARTELDAYRSPRVTGLSRAVVATDASRRETSVALADLFALLRPEPVVDLVEREARAELDDVEARMRDGTLTLRQARDRLAGVVGPPDAERPLLPHVDPESLRRREASLLLVGLAFFLLSFVVLAIVLATR
jgi:hypothetical protein